MRGKNDKQLNAVLIGILFTGLIHVSGIALGTGSAIRAGIQAYEKGDFAKAAAYFQEALQADPQNYYAAFNLGDALYRMGKYQEAVKAFEQALVSQDSTFKQRTYFNLGNTYFMMQNYEKAIAFYRSALRLNPSDKEAKHNLELALLKQKSKQPEKQKQNQQKGQNSLKPSEFAKRLKAMAEQLVAQNRYQEAYQLMQQGLKKDRTVAAFQDFIRRIGDVVEVLQTNGTAL